MNNLSRADQNNGLTQHFHAFLVQREVKQENLTIMLCCVFYYCIFFVFFIVPFPVVDDICYCGSTYPIFFFEKMCFRLCLFFFMVSG